MIQLERVSKALWLVRDQQYLQWASLGRGRNPLVMGAVYPLIFYVCASTLQAAFNSFDTKRIAVTGFSQRLPFLN